MGGWERGISGKVNFNSIVEPVCTEEILYKAGRRIVQPCGMMLVMKQISVHRRNRRCHSGFTLSSSFHGTCRVFWPLWRHSKLFANFLCDLGACNDSLWQLENWLRQRRKVTRFTQRLHVRSSDAWRLWSQLKSLDASSVPLSASWGETALDFCWEGKKCRVICSHLNPASAMHTFAGRLGRPQAGDNLAHKVHVHCGVDAPVRAGNF